MQQAMSGDAEGGGEGAEAQLRQRAESVCHLLQAELDFEQHLEAVLKDPSSLQELEGRMELEDLESSSRDQAVPGIAPSLSAERVHGLVLRWLQASAYQAYGLLAWVRMRSKANVYLLDRQRVDGRFVRKKPMRCCLVLSS